MGLLPDLDEEVTERPGEKRIGLSRRFVLRRTGRSVMGSSAWRREGAFGLARGGFWLLVGSFGGRKGEHRSRIVTVYST
jgi:hypothetical protein